MAVQSSNTLSLNKLQHIKFIFGKVHVDELMGGLNPKSIRQILSTLREPRTFWPPKKRRGLQVAAPCCIGVITTAQGTPWMPNAFIDTIITWHQMTPSRINIVFQSFEGCTLNKQSGYYIICLNTNPVWNTTKTNMKKKLCCFNNKPCPQQNGPPRVKNGVLNG